MGDIGEARQKVVADWLFLSAAMRGCADSINRYITLVASTGTHADTIKNMLQLPALPQVGIEQFIQHQQQQRPPQLKGSSSRLFVAKRERSAGSDDDVEEGGKKKRKKRVKKERDPDAPKRPGSAYIYFQNEVRNEMKERHPNVTYRDLVGLIATRWAGMTDAEKQPYQNEASEAMAQWKVDDSSFHADKAAATAGEVSDSNNLYEQSAGDNIAVAEGSDEDEKTVVPSF